MSTSKNPNPILGAAFLTATSAVGPGFLTQTTVFAQQLTTSFGFVILLSVLIDLCVQFNIWQIIVVSGKRAQDLANEVFPGCGYLLAVLIVIGGLAFNIGNIAGAGLGIEAMTGIPPKFGVAASAIVAILIFMFKEAGEIMDNFTKVLGILMVVLIIYVTCLAAPPLSMALQHTFVPVQFDALATITLVGGTVGGYISFAGAHRLLDSGLKGEKDLPKVNKSAGTAIMLTAVIRYFLFLATLGVVFGGQLLDAGNPAASVFEHATGNFGKFLFGLMIWVASITSVVGAAYTSVSFIRTFHPILEKNHIVIIIGFIVLSTITFLLIGKPVQILIVVGTLNGFILPIALSVLLIASRKSKVVGMYKHSGFLQITGWLVVIALVYLMIMTL